jgi:hypothetical protein
MDTLRKIIKSMLLNEFGRSLSTVNNGPISFKDFPGYSVEIYPNGRDGYFAKVSYENNDISTIANFKSQEEANHYARKVVEKHRMKIGNNL